MNEYVVLENEYITLKISHRGAAVIELTDAEGNLLMSKGSSLSFPVCAGVYGNSISIGESECVVFENGFIKDCEFMLLESYEDYAEFIFTSDDVTVKNYPFSFNVFVTYKLLGKALEINCRVGNFSEYKMPYSFGINTYFPHSNINIEFDRDEILEGHMLSNGLFCGDVKRVMPKNGKTLNVPEISEFVIKNIISDSFKILKDGNEFAALSVEGLPHLAVRSDVYGAEIGLWHGFAGTFGKKDDFIKKADIQFVDKNSSNEYSMLISFAL